MSRGPDDVTEGFDRVGGPHPSADLRQPGASVAARRSAARRPLAPGIPVPGLRRRGSHGDAGVVGGGFPLCSLPAWRRPNERTASGPPFPLDGAVAGEVAVTIDPRQAIPYAWSR